MTFGGGPLGFKTKVATLSLVVAFLGACERKAAEVVSEQETSKREPPMDVHEKGEEEEPTPELSLDPAVEDKGAPFAGLRVRSVGEPLGSTKHLVVLFHGYGARGDDLVPLAARLDEKIPATYVLPEAPFALTSGGRAWFARDRSNFDEGLSYARAVMESCAARGRDVKLVVGGFSQGAMLTANLLAEAPAQLVGALVLSPADYLPAPPGPDSRKVPIFLSHGTEDRILPFSGGERLKERLENAQYPVKFVRFDGRHQIPPDVVEEATEFMSSLYEPGNRPPRGAH